VALADTAYTGWQPVRIDAGDGSSSRGSDEGFFINSTGLQWNSAPGADPALDAFGGWIICDWWHGRSQNTTFRGEGLALTSSFSIAGVPQLFFRLSSYDLPLPASCADIYLRPEYI